MHHIRVVFYVCCITVDIMCLAHALPGKGGCFVVILSLFCSSI